MRVLGTGTQYRNRELYCRESPSPRASGAETPDAPVSGPEWGADTITSHPACHRPPPAPRRFPVRRPAFKFVTCCVGRARLRQREPRNHISSTGRRHSNGDQKTPPPAQKKQKDGTPSSYIVVLHTCCVWAVHKASAPNTCRLLQLRTRAGHRLPSRRVSGADSYFAHH